MVYDLSMLLGDLFWKNWSKDRYSTLKNSYLVELIAQKIRMKKTVLIGFIKLFTCRMGFGNKITESWNRRNQSWIYIGKRKGNIQSYNLDSLNSVFADFVDMEKKSKMIL